MSEKEQTEARRVLKRLAQTLIIKACKGDQRALFEDLMQAGWEGYWCSRQKGKQFAYAAVDARKSMIDTWCRWNWQTCRGSKTKGRPEEVTLTEDLEPSCDSTDEVVAKNLADHLRIVIWTNARGRESKLAMVRVYEDLLRGSRPVFKYIQQRWNFNDRVGRIRDLARGVIAT
jgi:hypothetical protein